MQDHNAEQQAFRLQDSLEDQLTSAKSRASVHIQQAKAKLQIAEGLANLVTLDEPNRAQYLAIIHTLGQLWPKP
jgi:hypothetical protein